MADNSKIEWTEATWNPVTGCTKVSPGCANCYAETFAERWRGIAGHPYEHGFDLTLRPERLDQPLRWTKPRIIFVNSMSDLFHEDIPDEYIERVIEVMAIADRHTFQVLTKRPERLRDYMRKHHRGARPMPNVWWGTSIENRRFVGRADALRETPAAVRFISAEPLLGPLVHDDVKLAHNGGLESCWSTAKKLRDSVGRRLPNPPELDLQDIDWLIVGGESGPGHRRMDISWARALLAKTEGTSTAFFMKQLGGARSGTKLSDLPEDLRVREYPLMGKGRVVVGAA